MSGQKKADDPLKAAQDLADELKQKSQKVINENIDRVTDFWGGPFRAEFDENDHNFAKYARDNVPFDLSPMFRLDSGWPRKLIWWFAFISIGIFFVTYLMGPEFTKWWTHGTTTNVRTESVPSIALPIVTICPNGNGMRCDCVLWKKLVCEFKTDREFSSFKDYFFDYVCEKTEIENNGPFDPDLNMVCDTEWKELGWESDKCGINGVVGQDLYYTILNRTEDGKPFVTAEELLLYGAVIYDDIDVTLNTLSLTGAKVQGNESWINYRYLALEERKVCTQITPLNGYNVSTSQEVAGSENGLRIIVKDTYEDVISTAISAGVIVYITVPTVPGVEATNIVSLDMPIPISGGNPSTISYEITKNRLLNDWGDNPISKYCNEEGETNFLCSQRQKLTRIRENCDACIDTKNAMFFGRDDSQSYVSYGCDITCHEIEAEPVNYDDCPILCETTSPRFTIYTERLSSYGVINDKKEGLTNQYLQISIGAASLDVSVKEEAKASTFGAMLGNVGGLANLYFGPDAMGVAGYFELIFFGFLLSFRTWNDEDDDEDEY